MRVNWGIEEWMFRWYVKVCLEHEVKINSRTKGYRIDQQRTFFLAFLRIQNIVNIYNQLLSFISLFFPYFLFCLFTANTLYLNPVEIQQSYINWNIRRFDQISFWLFLGIFSLRAKKCKWKLYFSKTKNSFLFFFLFTAIDH